MRRGLLVVVGALVGFAVGPLLGAGCHFCPPQGQKLALGEWRIDRFWVGDEVREGITWGRINATDETVTVTYTDGNEAEWRFEYAVLESQMGLQ